MNGSFCAIIQEPQTFAYNTPPHIQGQLSLIHCLELIRPFGWLGQS